MEQSYFSKFSLSLDKSSFSEIEKGLKSLDTQLKGVFGGLNLLLGAVGVTSIATTVAMNNLTVTQANLGVLIKMNTADLFNQQSAITGLGSSIHGVLGELKGLQTAKLDMQEFGNVNTQQLIAMNKLNINYNSSLQDILKSASKITDNSKMHFLLEKAVGSEIADMALNAKMLGINYNDILKTSTALNFITKEQVDNARLFTFNSKQLYGGLKSILASISAEIGKQLNPSLVKLISFISENNNKIKSIALAISSTLGIVIDYLVKIGQYVGDVISSISSLVGGSDNLMRLVTIFAGLVLAIKVVTVAFAALRLVASPIFLALTALAFIVDDIIVSFKGGDSILDWVGYFEKLKTTIEPFIPLLIGLKDFLVNGFLIVVDAVSMSLNNLYTIFKGLSAIISGIFNGNFKESIAEAKDIMSEGAKTNQALLKSMGNKAIEGGKSLYNGNEQTMQLYNQYAGGLNTNNTSNVKNENKTTNMNVTISTTATAQDTVNELEKYQNMAFAK